MVTVIVTEKPNSAKRIAQSLSEGEPKKLSKRGAYWFEIKRGGEDILVVPAVGHLFVLTEETINKEWKYPVFEVKWKPVFEVNKNNTWSRKYYQNIKEVSKKADKFISACDYDIEGSVIAYNILKFICNVKDGKRMKFSTLTKPDLISAYKNASQHLDFEQIEAGLTRHTLDFFWGINISRALIIALKNSGGYKTLSTGRVQGPTLKILEKRQKEIESFVPKPFWLLQLTGIIDENTLIALHQKNKFWKKEEADNIFNKCKGKNGIIASIEKKQYKQMPPFPFDLTTLQREAYSNFGYSPKQTLDIAQTLYEQALISYPRTSSQKLPEKIGYKNIIGKLKEQNKYKELCEKLLGKQTLKAYEGKSDDPAHPSIFPTGNKPKDLSDYQRKVYDLIVKRFLAVFADPALRETMKIIINIENENFVSEGVTTIEKNWIQFYEPYAKFKEQLLPELSENETVINEKLELLDKKTQPPNRYTQSTILKEMQKLGIGTKATRALILQTLYDRVYIKEKSIIVTELGKSVIDALDKYCNDIVSVELTRKFEDEMEAVRENKKKREDVIKEAKEMLLKILSEFKQNESKIGKELLTGIRKVTREERFFGKCECGGDLVIRTSRAGKKFVGCTNYPKCTETFSLPHKGKLTILSQKCDCGLYIVSVKRYKKRPWKLCIKCGFVNKLKKEEKKEE